MSNITNANSHRPSPAESPIIHSRLFPDPKKPLSIMDEKHGDSMTDMAQWAESVKIHSR